MKTKNSFALLTLGFACVILPTVALIGCAGKEVKVTRADLPAAVAATLDKEAAGGKVTEMEKEVVKGKTQYCFDVQKPDGEWDLCIAEDGKLIESKLDKPAKK